ncbi:MAG: hypothetical protein HRU06_19390 [Oceanospirillaceae bacterium]|nr:hypothetical protein [Oceanospirillaceae bacterium]
MSLYVFAEQIDNKVLMAIWAASTTIISLITIFYALFLKRATTLAHNYRYGSD